VRQKKEEKYVEDLLKEDDIDVIAVLNARFKHPIRTFIRSKLFVIKVNIKEYIQIFKFFVKGLLKK
jgi:hypothetical protein